MPEIFGRDYLVRRFMLCKWWIVIGAVLIFGLAYLVTHLIISTPLLVNPFTVAELLEEGQYPQDLMELVPLLLPILIDFVVIVVLIVIFFAFKVLRREKKYTQIILKSFYNEEIS